MVSALAAQGIRVEDRFLNFAIFTARVDAAGLAVLASRSEVASVREPGVFVSALPANPQRSASAPLTGSIPVINVREAWAAGFTGAGWYAAVLDTGIDK